MRAISKTGQGWSNRRFVIEVSEVEAGWIIPEEMKKAMENEEFTTGQEWSYEPLIKEYQAHQRRSAQLGSLAGVLKETLEMVFPSEKKETS